MTTAKIFGGNLTTGQQNIAVLGSTAGGGTNYSLDPNVLQNTNWEDAATIASRIQSPAPANVSNYSATQPYVAGDYAKDSATNTVYISLRGDIATPNLGNPLIDATWWKVVGNKFLITQEVINSIAFTLSTLIAEIQRAGLQDWISTTTYYQNAIVKEPSTTKIYYSKIANNIGNSLNDTNSWAYINDFINLQDLNLKYAALLNPAFQGTPTAPTPPVGDNSQKITTTAFTNLYTGNLKPQSNAITSNLTLSQAISGRVNVLSTGLTQVSFPAQDSVISGTTFILKNETENDVLLVPQGSDTIEGGNNIPPSTCNIYAYDGSSRYRLIEQKTPSFGMDTSKRILLFSTTTSQPMPPTAAPNNGTIAGYMLGQFKDVASFWINGVQVGQVGTDENAFTRLYPFSYPIAKGQTFEIRNTGDLNVGAIERKYVYFYPYLK